MRYLVTRRRRLALLFLVAAAALFAAGVARAQTNPTLTGERLFETGFIVEFAPLSGSPAPPPSNCEDPNGTSTFYFSAHGNAIGPYPGTFTETGSVTIGPQLQPGPVVGTGLVGPVISFDARFEIHSGETTIIGTKTLQASLDPLVPNQGACASFRDSTIFQFLQGFITIAGRVYYAQTSTHYEATIQSPTETSHDSGSAQTLMDEFYLTPESVCVPGPSQPSACVATQGFSHGIDQQFVSTTVIPPPPPTTPGCKLTGGGWIRSANGDKATFGGNAQAAASGEEGELVYEDHGPAQRLRFKSNVIDIVSCEGNRATILGQGEVEGQPVQFRLEATDGGATDTYHITWTGAGGAYDSGEQQVAGGNLTVH